MTAPTTRSSPWREPMVWLVVSGPVAVILASIFTVSLAIRHPDPPLSVHAAGSAAPAHKARNHAATGVVAEMKK
ncbi:hypothetical protein [Roseateles asaccharophilus]|uniref:Nitrogen fixation protein FixH n=1 Tax=Roseateles asaccharophilus TaxID=582607 RepID=A0ABU2A439_9BURK|nr:hypothetical protein [Roseateles asaccharophilus]MDR7331957.1 hypothetical protein [Roseateles asaccharophilus]